MEASVAFYRRLGVRIPDASPERPDYHRTAEPAASGQGVAIELDTVPFARTWDHGWTGGVVLGFRVESRARVDEIYADLTGAGYRGQQPPFDAFWGARYAVVEDPDGNPVGIMSPRDPAMGSRPPDGG